MLYMNRFAFNRRGEKEEKMVKYGQNSTVYIMLYCTYLWDMK